MNVSGMPLKTKLSLGFAVPMVAMAIITIVVYFSVNGMREASGWVDHTYRVIAEGKALTSAMIDQETGLRGFMVAGKDEFLEPYVAGQQNFTQTITALKKTVSDNPPQVRRLEGIEEQAKAWRDNWAEVNIALRRQVDREASSPAPSVTMADVVNEIGKGGGKQYMDALRASIDEFVDIERALIVVRTEEADSLGSLTIGLSMGGTLFALLVVGVITLVLTRDVRRSLGGEPAEMQNISERIAGGDLTIHVDQQAPTGIYAAMQSMVANLTNVVQQVRSASSSISHSATEIASGNMYLSERTEQQASSLEETASSMEEITSTVRQNADNARKAQALAEAASDDAERGGNVVGQAIDAMTEINASSAKISDIIGIIDEIAFQTNLLALNAAVEAARAGEQGRGFAVVAQEVRHLAQRSATAAREISELITDSVAKVDEGSKLVNASGDVLDGILKGVKQLSMNISEIAAASAEQTSGIEQVNAAITEMDKVTQQNAALVEQAAAASQSMQQSAESLEELMAFFNVAESSALGLPHRAG